MSETGKIVVSLNKGSHEISYEELTTAEAKERLATKCVNGFRYTIPTWQFNEDGATPEEELQARQKEVYNLMKN